MCPLIGSCIRIMGFPGEHKWFVLLFEMEFHVVQAGLLPYLPSAGMTSICHHTWVLPVSFLFCFRIYFYFMCIGILHVCPCEGIRSRGTGVRNSFELPCECWDLNLDPQEEQPVLLTDETSLHTHLFVLFLVSLFSLSLPFFPFWNAPCRSGRPRTHRERSACLCLLSAGI